MAPFANVLDPFRLPLATTPLSFRKPSYPQHRARYTGAAFDCVAMLGTSQFVRMATLQPFRTPSRVFSVRTCDPSSCAVRRAHNELPSWSCFRAADWYLQSDVVTNPRLQSRNVGTWMDQLCDGIGRDSTCATWLTGRPADGRTRLVSQNRPSVGSCQQEVGV